MVLLHVGEDLPGLGVVALDLLEHRPLQVNINLIMSIFRTKELGKVSQGHIFSQKIIFFSNPPLFFKMILSP